MAHTDNKSMGKLFLDNAADVTKKYGLKIASVGFTIGCTLMAQKFFQGADPLLFRNILAPIALITGSIAGFFGYERTNNTAAPLAAAFSPPHSAVPTETVFLLSFAA